MTDEELCLVFDLLRRDLDEASKCAGSITGLLWDTDLPAHVAADQMQAVKLLAGRCNRIATAWLKKHAGDDWTIPRRPR